ncbi:MAG: NUDIX hydrolase, partial [Myxococcales bacterium]|nr:NUDIX hydrolase [Myxococcales bacterium]
MSEPVTPRDAATVLLLREEPEGGFSVFMVKRHQKSGFMAGAYVFPGGTVDDADHGWTRVHGRAPDDAAALLGEDDGSLAIALHVAAIRETFEEAGVLIADGADDADLAAARASLHDGADFAALAEEHALTLRLDRIAPWSRWVTPFIESRRYDARFFLA